MAKGNRPRIPRQDAPKRTSGQIPSATAPPEKGVLFSFKHLDLSKKFSPARADGQWATKLVQRLKAVCQMESRELLSSNEDEHRCHPIDFVKTSEPDGFRSLPTHLRNDCQPHQFGLGKRNGRVHGFFTGEVFHIVWLDPDHKLYDGGR